MTVITKLCLKWCISLKWTVLWRCTTSMKWYTSWPHIDSNSVTSLTTLLGVDLVEVHLVGVDLVGSWFGGSWPRGSWFRGSWSRGHESLRRWQRSEMKSLNCQWARLDPISISCLSFRTIVPLFQDLPGDFCQHVHYIHDKQSNVALNKFWGNMYTICQTKN